jgi:hypothetical protein
MSSVTYNLLCIASSVGFHNKTTIPLTKEERKAANDAIVRQRIDEVFFLNILGYFPVFGLAPCIVRLLSPLCDKKDALHKLPTAKKIAEYVRGGLEGLGVGFIFILPDLAVTFLRYQQVGSLSIGLS